MIKGNIIYLFAPSVKVNHSTKMQKGTECVLLCPSFQYNPWRGVGILNRETMAMKFKKCHISMPNSNKYNIKNQTCPSSGQPTIFLGLPTYHPCLLVGVMLVWFTLSHLWSVHERSVFIFQVPRDNLVLVLWKYMATLVKKNYIMGPGRSSSDV